jgi:hypothetical protein
MMNLYITELLKIECVNDSLSIYFLLADFYADSLLESFLQKSAEKTYYSFNNSIA